MTIGKAIWDIAGSMGSTCAFAIPGAGPFVGALIMGVQEVGDLFFGANVDPTSLAATKGDLDQLLTDMKTAIADAIWANEADKRFIDLQSINGTVADVLAQPNGILGPFYDADAFPTKLAEQNWHAQITDFYGQLHGTTSPLREVIAFACDPNHIKYRFLTLPLLVYAVGLYFVLSRLYIAYALNACAREHGLASLKSDPAVTSYQKALAAWKLGGKQGPEPQAPPSIPPSDSQTVSPVVFEASGVAGDFIKQLKAIWQDSFDFQMALIQRSADFIVIGHGPYYWQDFKDTSGQTGAFGPQFPDQASAAAAMATARDAALDQVRQATQAATPGNDDSLVFIGKLNGMIKNWKQAQQNCLDYIQSYPLPT